MQTKIKPNSILLRDSSRQTKKYWRGFLISAVAILFFLGTAGYNYAAHKDGLVKWGSPDENANYIFAKLYAETGELKIFEKYNLIANDVIVPRSFRSDAGVIKPVSFLGIILIYGWIAKLAGVWILPYLTPLFGALGIIAFYLFLSKIFHRNNALISTLLLASFPPYIYYAARSLFHNILFIVFVVIGLNFLVRIAGKDERYKRLMFSGLAGLFIGLAVITRTSELMWLGPLLLIVWLFNFLRVSAPQILIFLALFCFALLPNLYCNKILYGSYFFGGYTEMNQSLVNITKASSEIITSAAGGNFIFIKNLFNTIKDNVFYFGFHPRQSAKMFYYYFVRMFPWIFWPAFLGFTWLIWKRKMAHTRHWIFFGTGFILSMILLFYYGSWEFHDNPDPKSFTIGNSYTRYWLPIYMCAFPLASLFIMKITSALAGLFLKNQQIKNNKFLSFHLRQSIFLVGARALLIIGIFFISLQFVLVGSAEGLVFSSFRQIKTKEEIRAVFQATESDSVIITEYHDKLLFPERKVIVGRFDQDKIMAEYKKLVALVPVYYYNFTLPEKDVEYLNTRRLPEFGLQIKKIKTITPDFSLYRLEELTGESALKIKQ